MKILYRYFLSELAKVFFVTLASFSTLFMIVGLCQQAYKEGLGLMQVAQLIPYLLPDVLRFALPGTALFAACVVYGRLAAGNEIVAIKSLGINPWWMIFGPALLPALLLSMFTVVINDIAVSWGREGVQRVVIRSLEEIAYSKLALEKSFVSANFSIHVKAVRGRKLILPTINLLGETSKDTFTITAEEAELRLDEHEKQLTVVMRNGTASAGTVSYHFDHEERHIPLDHLDTSHVASHLSQGEIPPKIRAIKKQLAYLEENQAAAIVYHMLSADVDELATPDFNADGPRRHQILSENIYRLMVETPRRWANGFSCFCFALVGIPLAIRFRNSSYLTSFAYCFLPILIVYYPILLITVSRAKEGDLPPMSVWFANALLIVVGTVFTWREVRR